MSQTTAQSRKRDAGLASPPLPRWGAAELTATRARVARGGHTWDLAVVGAGITGAGVARDAALRGLDVLVLEAEDVSFGTSSRSSRLIHGGVRYLEQGDLGLVFEALRERRRLYGLVPHLTRPAPFLFPAYRGDRWGPWLLRAGLTAYDLLDLYRGDGHVALDPEAAHLREPLLRAEGLRGAVVYEDAITDDARLTLAVLQDARSRGAEVAPYVRVQRLEGTAQGVELATSLGPVSARACVMAAGPWCGEPLLGSAGRDLLRLSKGVHVVLRAEDVPVRQPVVIQVPGQHRILFAVPWGARTYLGTTDSAYDGDPGASGVTPADEAEVLTTVGRVLAAPGLRPERIVSAWSGVRPLVRPAAAERSTVDVSRRHRVLELTPRAFAIVGGKLTTFRAMAQDVVDRVASVLERGGRPVPRCTTATTPLLSAGPPPDARADHLLRTLWQRHGAQAERLLARCEADPSLAEPLVADLPFRWVEVEHALDYEGCTHLIDILRRRLPLALTDPHLGGAVARRIAERLVARRGGEATEVDDELERYCTSVEAETRRRPSLP